MRPTFTSGQLSTAQAIGSTVGRVNLAYAQHCIVYSGSTSGSMLCSLTTADGHQGQVFVHPAASTAGLWVVPLSTKAVVHYF